MKNTRTKKKILALLMVMCMMVTIMPSFMPEALDVSAADGNGTRGGAYLESGTAAGGGVEAADGASASKAGADPAAGKVSGQYPGTAAGETGAASDGASASKAGADPAAGKVTGQYPGTSGGEKGTSADRNSAQNQGTAAGETGMPTDGSSSQASGTSGVETGTAAGGSSDQGSGSAAAEAGSPVDGSSDTERAADAASAGEDTDNPSGPGKESDTSSADGEPSSQNGADAATAGEGTDSGVNPAAGNDADGDDQTLPAPGPLTRLKGLLSTKSSASTLGKGDRLSVGANIKYTHSSSTHTFSAGDYVGKCCKSGVPAASSGTGKVSKKLGNTTALAKLAYHFTYVDNKLTSSAKPPGYSSETWSHVFNYAIQYLEMGAADWKAGMSAVDYDSATITKFENTVKQMISESGSTTVPSGFEMFRVDENDNSYQPFYLWLYEPDGYVTLKKSPAYEVEDPEGRLSLAGAVYYVYKDKNCSSRAKDTGGNDITLTTNDQGMSNTVQIAVGTYYAKEITPSPGYNLDPNVLEVTVSSDNGSDNPAQFRSLEEPSVSYVCLKKSSGFASVYYPIVAPNNYSLANAQYELYKDAACTDRATDVGGSAITFTTDANGDTAVFCVLPGIYYAKEVSPAKGHRLTTDSSGNLLICSGEVTAANTEDNPAVISSTDPPVYAPVDFRLKKTDKSGKNGWYYLKGAEYTLRYYDADPETGDVSGMQPKRSWTFVTVGKRDENGVQYAGIDFENDAPVSGDAFYIEGGRRVLPRGVFTIEETKAPEFSGMARNTNIYYGKVYQPGGGDRDAPYSGAHARIKNNTTGDDTLLIDRSDDDQLINYEPPQTISIRIEKKDSETKLSQAQGQISDTRLAEPASLAGARYKVWWQDYRQPHCIEIGEIVTDEKGHGEIREYQLERKRGEELEPGRYFIEEVEASPGYTIDDLYYSSSDDLIERAGWKLNGGRHAVDASVQEINTGKFVFTVESLETIIRTPVSKTDATSGEELPGAKLQIINAEGTIVEEWISGTEPHMVWGLHPGRYTLREITAPYGYDIAEDIEFTIEKNVIEQPVQMQNKPISVETAASGKTTGIRHGLRGTEEIIRDTVRLKGLTVGREYRLSGNLYNRESGRLLEDAGGDPVTAEKIFTAESEEAEIEVEFTVDSSAFTKDTTLVAFEYLSRVSRLEGRDEESDFPGEEFPKELAKHEDPDDEAQAVHYGGIVKTIAEDKSSGSHNILAGPGAVITDRVEYHNLSPGQEYKLEGELFDKTTGQLSGIRSEAVFTPEQPDGTALVEFSFDATELKNHSLVVFETLSANGIIIDEHRDPEDPDQTVTVPEIRTNAADIRTQEHLANGTEEVEVKDIVTYSNLTPGREYEIVGTLMNKESGKPVRSKGKKVTASVTFTPTEANGSVELTFSFSGVKLRGKTVVAFEECRYLGVPVAVHADLNDEDQSVHIPKVATKAGKKSGQYVKDKVSYSNLIPGRTYVVRGYFVKKSDGSEVEGSYGETVFKAKKPDGFVYVRLRPGKATGKLVAFESLYLRRQALDDPEVEEDVLIGEHKDIKDRAQTVTISPKSPKTGDETRLFIYGGMLILSAALAALMINRRERRQN